MLSRNIYLHCFPNSESLKTNERGITDVSKVSDLITQIIKEAKPCMIARFGSNELDIICNYLAVNKLDNKKHSFFNYIKNNCTEWWWNPKYIKRMFSEAGFFPSNPNNLTLFSKLMLEDCKEIDILGSWRKKETILTSFFSTNIIRFDREKINPFFAEKPWTLALENKKVLIVHPFKESIIRQYKQKDKIFTMPFLPNFDLIVLKAVQSVSGNSKFTNWFEALDFMKTEMDKIDYDIALIGCGAYGLPLAAHAKKKGKIAIHIGGSLQLFFGIKGKRWESEGYKNSPNDYSKLYNDFWIRPSISETPKFAKKVENACYW